MVQVFDRRSFIMINEQKIVIKLQVGCDKRRSKAMKLAASVHGTLSVTLAGEDRNQLVVVGDGVNAVRLTRVLRKKVGRSVIIK